jgi:hypothetical protein
MNDEFENLPPEEKEPFGTQNVVISLIGERSRVCCNDELAAAACQKLKERGIIGHWAPICRLPIIIKSPASHVPRRTNHRTHNQ